MNIFRKTLKKFKHQQQILAILVFALVAVAVWISASLFTSQRRLGISKDQLKLSKPLTPNIDEEVVLNLEKKHDFSDQDLRRFPIYMVLKDEMQIERVVEIGTELNPSPSPSVVPLSNYQLSPSPQASASAP